MITQFLPYAGVVFAGFILFIILVAVMFRRVVSTNVMHIVQSRKRTTPYGTGQKNGNVYYAWPSWIPLFGITVIKLPVSNFDLSLKDYEAYDTDRVPFMVDVTAFFRISDTALAAQRVASIDELNDQLKQIVQGAVRKVLAGDKIDSIMLERSKFGKSFTDEVEEQLKQWGVEPVKSMELMDIRDGRDSQVISNIMAKKTSLIEMESRKEVAENMRAAQIAEVDATRDVDIQKQQAEQAVGERTAEKEKTVGIAREQAKQDVLSQQKTTRERDMEVKRVEQVKQAEITRDEKVVTADQEKQTKIIIADGELEAKKKEASAIETVGKAKAEAEKAMQLAPVQAQIELAKEIGGNAGYQQYLVTIEAVKAYLVVGGEQAKALQTADVKIIANAGQPNDGMKGVMDLFTSKGGTNLAAMLEALAQSPLGKTILGQITGSEKLAEPKEDHK